MAKDNVKLYPYIKYISSDNITFDNIRTHTFDPIWLQELFRNYSIDVIEQKYRIDLVTYKYTQDFGLIKTVSIMNSKSKGIFSYDVDDQILIPDPDNVSSMNANYKIVQPVDSISINFNVRETLLPTYDNYLDNLKFLGISKIYYYINQVDKRYILLDNLENQVNSLYKGIINAN